jgi:CMP/dCMP kinase
MSGIIAIDGAAGSGKSTLARLLARALSLPYINTGLMYRALTRLALDVSVSSDDGPALAALIDRLSFGLSRGDDPELEVEGYDLRALETFEVDSTVSAVARHPEVREPLRVLQRAFGEREGAVMEGRDIGSVVFPDARVKLYLVADPVIRAGRRSIDRSTSAGGVEEALHSRDERDARTNAFEPAEGAIVIDTASADASDVLERALEVVADVAPDLLPEAH